MQTLAKRKLPNLPATTPSKCCCLLLWLLSGLFIPGMAKATGSPSNTTNNHPFSFVLSGTITNEKDEPLIGASIHNKTNGKNANTDANGKFLIEAESESDSLEITYVGYVTRLMVVGPVKTITIVLQTDVEGRKLNEVQVVGYGVQKKATVLGSVATVSIKDVQKYATPSLTNAISGRLAGVITRQTSGEPGYDAARVYIRGLVSQSGERRPLIIVDGAERELNDYWTTMNVQEIESFSVLKDASATAVYGNRGANGVILITTKRGVVGKPKVTFRTETAIATPMRIEDNINGYEYASLINENRLNTGGVPQYTDEQLQKFKDGSDPFLYPSVDWNRIVFRKHTKQTINNLGLTGGTDAFKYYVNLGYQSQQGIYNEDDTNSYKTNASLKRYSFRSNIDIKINKNLSLDLGLSAILSTTNFPGTGAGRIFDVLKLVNPILYPVKNPNGSMPGAHGDFTINPYGLITQTGYTRQHYNTTVSNLGIKWNLSSITPGLTARGLAAFDVVDITQNVREKRPATFLYSKSATGADVYTPYSTETALGFRNLNENYKTLYGELSLNYDRYFGKHSVSGMILAQRREYVNVNAGNSVGNLPQRRQGLVSRLTYNYDTRYLIEVNAAYTGSENFPKHNRYGLFPSVGAGWIVSNEAFWNRSVVTNLKFRGSIGQVGNDRIGGDRFLFISTFNKSANGYEFGQGQTYNTGGVSEARIGNPDVTWEMATKSNVGIDLELWNGKLTLVADVFHERRDKQLLERRIIPAYTGYPGSTIPFGNVGVSTSQGFDGSLQIRNATKGGFYYSFIGNFTYAKSNVVENDAPPALYPWQDLRNHVIDANLGYVEIGLFRDQDDIDKSPVQQLGTYGPGDIKYKDINGDNFINNADRVVIGDKGVEPQIMYGFGTTLAYKGFDMTVFFTGVAKRDFFFSSATNRTAFAFGGGEAVYNVMRLYYDNRWIPGADNTDAKFPAIRASSTNNYTTSTLWYRKGDYLRLRNAEIGYTLPQNLVKRVRIGSLRLFVQGTNLFTWDDIEVIDPESNFGTGYYPITRNFNFGLEVNF